MRLGSFICLNVGRTDSQPWVRKQFAGGTPNFKQYEDKPIYIFFIEKKMIKGYTFDLGAPKKGSIFIWGYTSTKS
jgi:hypothetical protein